MLELLRSWFELPGMEHLQNLHPLVVHYPIALLSSALLVYLMSWIFRMESWQWPALWMLVLGAVGAVAAAGTGLYGAEGVMVAPEVRSKLLEVHEHIMLVVVGLALVAALWAWLKRPMPTRGRLLFIFLLLAMVALMTKGADYGGRMVYDYNAGGSLPQPIDFSR